MVASFVSQIRNVSDQTRNHTSRYLAKEQIVFLEPRLTLGNVVGLHISSFHRVEGGSWTETFSTSAWRNGNVL